MPYLLSLTLLACAAAFTHGAAEDHTGHDHAAGTPHAEHHDEGKTPHGGILKEVSGGHLELTHNASEGFVTLYVLDENLLAHPIPAKSLTIHLKSADSTVLVPVTMTPVTADQASEFTGGAEALKGLANFTIIARIELNGANQLVVFSFAGADAHTEGDGHKH